MKNFIRLSQLVIPASDKGFYLSLEVNPTPYTGMFSVRMYKGTPSVTTKVISKLQVTDGELETVINEVVDHLAGKFPTAGVHNVVVVNDTIFQVTEKEDCLYVWSTDEIGECLSEDVFQAIENKFMEECDVFYG